MTQLYGNVVATCGKCGKPIGDQHPYTWCAECGEPLSEQVMRKIPGLHATEPALIASTDEKPVAPSGLQAVAHVDDMAVSKGSEGACISLGVVFLLIGGYFLLNPSVEGSVVNMQRLTIGETSSIVGAIFLAAGLRPR